MEETNEEQPSTTTSVAMEARVVELEAQNTALKEQVQLLLDQQKAERALLDAQKWADDGKITPAQLEFTKKLLVTLSDTQRELFEQIVTNNSIGLEKESKGMVPTKPAGSSGPDYDSLDNETIELMYLARANAQAEQAGAFGNGAKHKHNNGYLLGMYPSGGE